MLAFVHIPRTGGTTTNWILRSTFGLHHCDVESWRSRWELFSADDLRLLRRFYPQLRSIAGHRVVPYMDLAEACSHIRYFTFLRDPLKRCASFFQFRIERHGDQMEFEDWIRREEAQNGQTRKITGTASVSAAIRMIERQEIFVGLLEYFDESLLLLKALVCPELSIAYQRRNVARDDALARNLLDSPSTRRMLIEANQADLELYDWVKRFLYPSYRRKYDGNLEQDMISFKQGVSELSRRDVILNRLYRNLVYKPALKTYRLLHSLRQATVGVE